MMQHTIMKVMLYKAQLHHVFLQNVPIMDMPAAKQLVQFCNLYATQQGIHLQHEMCMPCMHGKRVAQNLASKSDGDVLPACGWLQALCN